MRAVNLIPADARRRGPSSSTGLPFFGLVGGLVLVLLATFLLVTTENRVSSRESQLRVTQAAAARWSAVAGAYASDVSLEKQRGVKVAMVKSLAGQRYAWSQLLDQLASALPRTTTLSTLTSATTAPTATSATPASTTSATSSSAPTVLSAPSQITLAACAPSQAGVAATIVNLRRIHGVSEVLLSSTTTGSGGSGGGGGASCGDVSFGLTLTFAASTTPTSAAASTTAPTASSPATRATRSGRPRSAARSR